MNEYVKNLNRIEFEVTLACTGNCKHCSEGDHAHHTGHIDTATAVNAIREICNHYPIQSLMTFGGEALLYPDVVCSIHRVCAELGIPKRDLITNGYFSKDFHKIRDVVHALHENGVLRILLSVDAFHQETIPLAPVKYFAECVKETPIHIALSPAWLVCESDPNPYNLQTKAILQEFDALHIPVGAGNVIFPSGNARKYLREYFDENMVYTNPYDEDPYDVRTVSFSPNGEVLGGNVYQTKILDILDTYHP